MPAWYSRTQHAPTKLLDPSIFRGAWGSSAKKCWKGLGVPFLCLPTLKGSIKDANGVFGRESLLQERRRARPPMGRGHVPNLASTQVHDVAASFEEAITHRLEADATSVLM